MLAALGFSTESAPAVTPTPPPPSTIQNGVLSNTTRRTYEELSSSNMIKFGDEIRLIARSTYTKKPKPAWLDPTGQGWAEEELKAGALGMYEKADGVKRLMVPPKGDLAAGTFRESYYRVEDPLARMESHGHRVSYGQKVVLVDEDGLVWNNKTGGLFYDGYLAPAPKGAPGEVFVTFSKNGKNGDAMCYGEVAVYVDVVDSHRHRVGFNNRLTNYKSGQSNVLGGYVCCDGSGDLLPLIVQKYQGRIKPRQSAFASSGAGGSAGGAAGLQKGSMLTRGASAKGFAPDLVMISVVSSGMRDVMRVSPAYGDTTVLYGVRPDSQVEMQLADGSTAVIDGAELLGESSTLTVATHGTSAGQGVQLVLTWTPPPPSLHAGTPGPAGEVKKKRAPVLGFVTAALALTALYMSILALMRFGLGWEHRNRGSFLGIIVCWLAGLVTPRCARTVTSSSRQRLGAAVAVQVCVIAAEPGRENTPSAELFDQREEMYVGEWAALGTDAKTGTPLHPAFVRFLNGEQGDMVEALRRWQVTCEWRAENGVDRMLQTAHRMFFLIKAHYPHYFYGRDRYGHPVYIERVGKVNMSALRLGGAKLRDMIHHYIYTAEFMWRVLEPTEYGQSLTILDATGIGLFDFAGEVIEFVKKATAVVQLHYPERGFMVFVINVPYWFSTVWAVVRTWINPRTLNKIRILGKDYHAELHKFVDPANLPADYGGTNPLPLEESSEERLLRNTVVRALLDADQVAIDAEGNLLPREALQKMIDPSVDAMAKVSRMSKVGIDGELLCDAAGRPVVKKFA